MHTAAMTTRRRYEDGGTRWGPLALAGAVLILLGSLIPSLLLFLLGLAFLVPALIGAVLAPAAPVERPARPWERDRT